MWLVVYDLLIRQGMTVRAFCFALAISACATEPTVDTDVDDLAFVAKPTFDPPGGKAQLVAITSATAGAAIYYTTDGSTPTTSSARYAKPIRVNRGDTVKAIAVLGATSLFEQPVAAGINLLTSPAVPHLRDTPGVFTMLNWQTNPNTASGNLVVNKLSVAAKTGFAPVDPATAQLGYRNSATATTAQMEDRTVAAYLTSADLPGAGLDSPTSQNKMMITPEIEWDYATATAPLSASGKAVDFAYDLKVPTAVGSDCYVVMDSLWQNAAGDPIELRREAVLEWRDQALDGLQSRSADEQLHGELVARLRRHAPDRRV